MMSSTNATMMITDTTLLVIILRSHSNFSPLPFSFTHIPPTQWNVCVNSWSCFHTQCWSSHANTIGVSISWKRSPKGASTSVSHVISSHRRQSLSVATNALHSSDESFCIGVSSNTYLAVCILATQQLRLQFHKRAADQQLHAITLARELQSMLAEVAAQQSVRLAAAEERGVGMGEKGRRLRETGLIGGTLRGERAGAAAGANGSILANALGERGREVVRPDNPEKRAGGRSRNPLRGNGS